MKKAAAPLAIAALALAGFAASSLSTAAAHPTRHTATAAAACPSDPVNFAVEPYDTGTALEKAYASLATDLGQKLGCPVKLIISNSYVAEIETMKSGSIQIGEFGPLGYVLAHSIADAQPVAAFGDKNGKPDTYNAGIWVPKSSPITSLKQLAGKTLALDSTTSTSGGLYPISALIDAGFTCTIAGCTTGPKVSYLGSHTATLLALTHGTADAAEVNTQQESSATAAGQFKKSDYREIWKSTPIINDPITVSGKLPVAFQKAVQSALLGLTAKQVSVVDTELGTANNGKMLPANDALYNQVRAVANAVHLTTKDLG